MTEGGRHLDGSHSTAGKLAEREERDRREGGKASFVLAVYKSSALFRKMLV